ncbi:hypothetical protein Dimus_020643 [Dionaea muscipula]
MKIVFLRFGKRETTSFMDLTYMDHISTRRLVNLPRVMLRHMAYVIPVKDQELSYGDWLTMVFEAFNVHLIDKQGEEPKRRRDDEIDAPAEHNQNEEGEEVEKEVEIQEGSGSDDKFYDTQVEVEALANEVLAAPAFPASPADSSTVQKEKAPAGVDPSAPTGSIPNSVFMSLQAELEHARADRIQTKLDRA